MKRLLGIAVLGLLFFTSLSQGKEKAIYCNKVIRASNDIVFDLFKDIEIRFFIDEKNKKVRVPHPVSSVDQKVYNVKFNPDKNEVFWQLVTTNPLTNKKNVNVHYYRTDLKQFATRVFNYKANLTEKDLKAWYTFQCN